MRIPRLSRVLSYKNPEIIARFRKDFGLPKKISETIFEDMLRYLWVATKADLLIKRDPEAAKEVPRSIDMREQYVIVDEMWHTFILYSQAYAMFCKKYFGYYIYHSPTPTLRTRTRKRRVKPGEVRRENDRLVEFVWNELGKDVAVRWFQDYPRKFSKRTIRRLQLKAVA
jgi:hypothetical protein